MKGIFISMLREFKLIFRNGVSIYMVIAPALLALIFLSVFGNMQQAAVSLVVDKSISQEIATRLSDVADLEHVEDYDALKKRISGSDSIAGVYMKDGNVKLLVEGNEPQGFRESMQALVSTALVIEDISYRTEAVEGREPLAYKLSLICIFLLALFIGGATLGLGGVTERENGFIRAVTISPMTLPGYVLSKLIPATLLGVVGTAACTLIVGKGAVLTYFTLLALCSTLITGTIIFLIIAFADNQVAATGVLKIILPLFSVTGISAAFIPEKWLLIYYGVPIYWQYAAIDAIGAGKAAAFPIWMVLLTSIPWFLIVMFIFIKRTKIKGWR